MATIGYILLGSDPDDNYLQACDIGKADQCFLEGAPCKSIRTIERPKFLEALSKLREGDTFVVSTLSVLSNSPKGMLEALNTLRKKGATVVFVQEGFTLSSRLGRAYLATLRSLAQLENTARRIRL